MDIDVDPAKDSANLAKHGVGLRFGARVFDDPRALIVPSIRPIDGETRLKAIGMVDGRLFTAIHVWRSGVLRLISVRRSNVGEQRDYDRASG